MFSSILFLKSILKYSEYSEETNKEYLATQLQHIKWGVRRQKSYHIDKQNSYISWDVNIIYKTCCPEVQNLAKDSNDHFQHWTTKLNMTLMETI